MEYCNQFGERCLTQQEYYHQIYWHLLLLLEPSPGCTHTIFFPYSHITYSTDVLWSAHTVIKMQQPSCIAWHLEGSKHTRKHGWPVYCIELHTSTIELEDLYVVYVLYTQLKMCILNKLHCMTLNRLDTLYCVHTWMSFEPEKCSHVKKLYISECFSHETVKIIAKNTREETCNLSQPAQIRKISTMANWNYKI